MMTRFGKIGADGNTRLKRFNSASEAEEALEAAVAQKVARGFVEKAVGSMNEEESGSWSEVLPQMLDDYNSVTPKQAVSCLIGILQDNVISWESYGEAEALAHRIVWKFPDDDETLLWVTREGETLLSQLHNEFNSKSPWPWPGVAQISSGWTFSPDSNGWKYDGVATAWELRELLSEELGEPLMVLPWESIATRIADEDFEEFASNYFPEFEDDDAEATKAKALYRFYSQVADMSLELPDDLGEFGHNYGDDFMPRYSKAGRFNAFLGELEDEHGWGIVYDECCGTCSSGTISDLRQQDGMEDASFFITWAQNAEGTWGTSGWVSHMAYHPDEEEQKIIMGVAASHGLTVTQGEKEGEKDGFLYIS